MKKHILCFGDSNTHGYCADPSDSAEHGERFNEDERWTCLLQKALGDEYLVLENGLNGRTTAFSDPFRPYNSGLDAIEATIMSHRRLDLLIIMLGTNDTKERYGMNPTCIGFGLEKLCFTAEVTDAWVDGKPNILVIAPPHIKGDQIDPSMGLGCQQRSAGLAPVYRDICQRHGWHFMDCEGVAEFNTVDYMHFTARGHRQLAEKLTELVPTLI